MKRILSFLIIFLILFSVINVTSQNIVKSTIFEEEQNIDIQKFFFNFNQSLNSNIKNRRSFYNNDFYDKDQTLKNKNIYFNGKSNASIYVIKVISPNEFGLYDIELNCSIFTKGHHNTSGAEDIFGYYTDGKILKGFCGSGSSEGFRKGELRYRHLRLGKLINHTYSNRHLYNKKDNEMISGSSGYQRCNRSFGPGTWYFIFFGIVYDIEQEFLSFDWDILMNFTCENNELEISAYGGGKTYGIWYGEFNANVIVSRSFMFEMILNAKEEFHIENTFIYSFDIFGAFRNGFFNIQWDTPEGSRKIHINSQDSINYYLGKYNGYVYGIGPAGDYRVTTSYLSFDPIEFFAGPLRFYALDLELK